MLLACGCGEELKHYAGLSHTGQGGWQASIWGSLCIDHKQKPSSLSRLRASRKGTKKPQPIENYDLRFAILKGELVVRSAPATNYFAAAVRSAASMVLTKSMVMVMGPTPPGTGVM